MPKIYKPGKVALVLQGRYAGRKVVVIRQSDEGTKVRYTSTPEARKGGPGCARGTRTGGGRVWGAKRRASPWQQGKEGAQGMQGAGILTLMASFIDAMQERPYPHAIVAGIERYPRKVTKGMGKKRIEKRSKVKPFIKVSHRQHTVRSCLRVVVTGQAGHRATRRARRACRERTGG
jgi:ribosomal protein L14E/L6E/L27E